MPQHSAKSDAVCIVGFGYVGLTLAVAMANAGFRLHGVERSKSIVRSVQKGKAHFFEKGLDEHLSRHVAEGRLTVSEDISEGPPSAAYIITVGTPLTPNGFVNLTPLKDALRSVAAVLKDGDLVILRSTVKVGVTRNIAARELSAAGKTCDVAFCPERTLEGRALEELSSLPQIVGGLTPRATERAAALFAKLCPNIVRTQSPEAAEMAKLINNAYRDVIFAFANEIAEMCDATGTSAMDVIGAACKDYPRARIPPPGPVGGACLAKDPHILAEGLRELGYTPSITLAARQVNENLPQTSVFRIAEKWDSLDSGDLAGRKITLLGLAFKGTPETNDLRGTMAVPILAAARARWPGAKYFAYDPIVSPNDFDQFSVTPCNDLAEAFAGASLVMIQNNHRAFADMPLAALAAEMAEPGLIFDYWNLFGMTGLLLPRGRYYAGLGTLAGSLPEPIETSLEYAKRHRGSSG